MAIAKAYARRANLLPVALVAYVLIAVLARPANSVELYPFFNWHLFSDAHAPMTRAEIRVRSLNGESFAQSRDYFELGETFPDAAMRDSRVPKAAMRWANAIATGDLATQRKMRDIVENHHLRAATSVEYDLVVTTFDPIERYNSGAIIGRQLLGSYTK